MTDDELFERLTENAFDFLENALKALRKSPKYSMIDFYSAVELFLKARLCAENWELVVVSDDHDRTRLETGDFVSVSFKEACKRLKKIDHGGLTLHAHKVFDAVRKRRNRTVHFSHKPLVSDPPEAIIEEQLRAWYHLNKLLTDQWKPIFDAYYRNVSNIEELLVGHREYLDSKYYDLRPSIEIAKDDGRIFRDCINCLKEAAQVNGPWSDCIVCGQRRLKLSAFYDFPVTEPSAVYVVNDLDEVDLDEQTARHRVQREWRYGQLSTELNVDLVVDTDDELTTLAVYQLIGVDIYTELWLLTSALTVFEAVCRHARLSPRLESDLFAGFEADDPDDDQALAAFTAALNRLVCADGD